MLQPAWATVLLCALLAACPGQSKGSATQPTGADGVPRLDYDGQALNYSAGSRSFPLISATDITPYRVIAAGELVIVTSLLTGRQPGPHPQTAVLKRSNDGSLETLTTYRDWLPTCIAPPLVAFSPLPNPLTALAGDVLYWRGEKLFRREADAAASVLPHLLLRPAAEADASGWRHNDVLLVPFNPHELIRPFGTSVKLRILHPVSQQPDEQLDLQPAGAVADVVLLAQTADSALLALQYDYEEFEFVSLTLNPPRITGRWTLHGQPATRTVYPGPGGDYPSLEQTGKMVSLVVLSRMSKEPAERWSFDMLSGSREVTAHNARIERAVDLPRSRPGVPYPQTLLPSAGKPPWTIPALLDGAGRVLVVRGDGRLTWLPVPE